MAVIWDKTLVIYVTKFTNVQTKTKAPIALLNIISNT